MTTRERKIEFIKSDGGYTALMNAVTDMFAQRGEDWLTDDQLDDLVRDQIDNRKRSQRMNRENRARAYALATARRGRDEAAA